jgi:hypothetical protein
MIENLHERAVIAGDLDTVRFLMTALELPIQEAIIDRAQFALTGDYDARPIYTRPFNGIGNETHRFCRACNADVIVDRDELRRKIREGEDQLFQCQRCQRPDRFGSTWREDHAERSDPPSETGSDARIDYGRRGTRYVPETVTRHQHILEVWDGIKNGRIPEERILQDLDQHVLAEHGVAPEHLPGWQVVGMREVYSRSSNDVSNEMIRTDPNSGGQSSHTELRPGGQ